MKMFKNMELEGLSGLFRLGAALVQRPLEGAYEAEGGSGSLSTREFKNGRGLGLALTLSRCAWCWPRPHKPRAGVGGRKEGEGGRKALQVKGKKFPSE